MNKQDYYIIISLIIYIICFSFALRSMLGTMANEIPYIWIVFAIMFTVTLRWDFSLAGVMFRSLSFMNKEDNFVTTNIKYKHLNSTNYYNSCKGRAIEG